MFDSLDQDIWSAGSGANGTSAFPDPCADYASTAMPRSIQQAHRWGEYLFNANGLYASAIDRVLSYFVTDVKIVDEDIADDEKEEWDRVIDLIDFKTRVRLVARDFLAYGITLNSFLPPIRRFLQCPTRGCGQEFSFDHVVDHKKDLNYRWENFQFQLNCPKCGERGSWKQFPRKDVDEANIVIRRWSPKEIDIRHNRITQRSQYLWRIPEDIRQQVRKGHDHVLADTPWEVIDAVQAGTNLRFDRSQLFVAVEESLAGFDLQGWGWARVIANFRQAWYVQLLHRLNEAIAQDYIIPLRVVSPAKGADAEGNTDQLLNADMLDFVARTEAMIRARRVDPAAWFVSPIPVQYQILGGDAKQLVPFELMDQGVSVFLNNIGVPVELYKSTLSLQAFPVAARLFESTWSHLVHLMNRFVQWLADQIALYKRWQRIKAKLEKTSIVDDLQNSQIILNLMAAREFSRTDGLARLGASFRDQQRKILDEERYLQDLQAKVQEEMDTKAFGSSLAPTPMQQLMMAQQQQQMGQQPGGGGAGGGGGAPPGGAPGAAAQGMAVATPPGPQTPTNPDDLLQSAQYESQRIMQLPAPQRRSELSALKQKSEVLHKLTVETMDQERQRIDSQAGQQARQQQYGSV